METVKIFRAGDVVVYTGSPTYGIKHGELCEVLEDTANSAEFCLARVRFGEHSSTSVYAGDLEVLDHIGSQLVMFLEPYAGHQPGDLAILQDNGFVKCGENCGFWLYREKERDELIEILESWPWEWKDQEPSWAVDGATVEEVQEFLQRIPDGNFMLRPCNLGMGKSFIKGDEQMKLRKGDVCIYLEGKSALDLDNGDIVEVLCLPGEAFNGVTYSNVCCRHQRNGRLAEIGLYAWELEVIDHIDEEEPVKLRKGDVVVINSFQQQSTEGAPHA